MEWVQGVRRYHCYIRCCWRPFHTCPQDLPASFMKLFFLEKTKLSALKQLFSSFFLGGGGPKFPFLRQLSPRAGFSGFFENRGPD